MESISLSVNPTYYCNFRCSFCYLSPQQLSDAKRISAEQLFRRLTEISTVRKIDRVDLYGGEIGLLRPEYFQELKNIIQIFYSGEISVISNLSVLPKFFMDSDIDLSISWDYTAREKCHEVYSNMLSLQRPFRILVLASDKLVNLAQSELDVFVGKLKDLKNLQSIEIKPYSVSRHNSDKNAFLGFEELVKRFLNYFPSSELIEFINRNKIEDSLNGAANAWSDDHLYITPDGNWAVLEFDEQNREYFKELASYQEYLEWIHQERDKVSTNVYCRQCKYLGKCLSEHLQVVQSDLEGCNGFKGLLDWYAR